MTEQELAEKQALEARLRELELERSALLDGVERRLAGALQRLRLHADSSPLAVVEWCADFRVRAWNAAAERVFGWSADEVLGRGIEELGIVYPDDLARVRAVSAEMASGAPPGNLNVHRNVRKDGVVIECEWYNSALHDRAGALLSVLSLVLDVTERNRAQALAASVARFPRENPDPVFRLGRDGRIAFANDAAISALRALPLVPGRPAPEPLAPLAARALREGGRVLAEVESGDRVFALSLVAVADDEVNVYGHDVTARKRAEEELREAKERVEESDRRKSEFIAMLSHELRNPLAPIRNVVHILKVADPAGEQARRARAVIERQVEHLTRLVDDLLDVTRIVRGKVALRRERVDGIAVVRRTAEDHRPLLYQGGVSLTLDLPEGPVWLDADPTRLAQVVGNLLQNAAKFTPYGGRVTVGASVTGCALALRVADTGEGIEPELLGRIFEPFVQAERSLARSRGGLGLGLALVKGLVELHGGTVHGESAGAGQGAVFHVVLPLAVAAEPRAAAGRAAHGPGGARRVLVVEDNADAAQTLADLVALLGHDVEVARDGLEALRRAAARRPDVVLCDLGLPGMSGYEVARALREAPGPRIQLVAVSGYAQPDDVERAFEAGFDGHVAKPPDPARLEVLLREGPAAEGAAGACS